MTAGNEAFTPVFLGSGRCFHTMDWFRSCQRLAEREPIFVTDNHGGEGFIPLLQATDQVRDLALIDPLLFKRPSRLGHAWRNLVKFALIPWQIFKLKAALRSIPQPFVFAHSTYYAFLASFCAVPYSATPQGSEVLVRPYRSKLYRALLLRSVRCAAFATVDSNAMAARLHELLAVAVHIIQNGIDVASIRAAGEARTERRLLTSIRGFDANYRIVEILRARDEQIADQTIDFCFPFVEGDYEQEIRRHIRPTDVLHGRLPRARMYSLLQQSIGVVSIPRSDSSPRSVYEAIFCGATVLCTHAPYVDALPECMRRRVVVVRLEDPHWLANGLATARQIASEPYVPSSQALDLFDQVSSMRKCLSLAAAAMSAHSSSSNGSASV